MLSRGRKFFVVMLSVLGLAACGGGGTTVPGDITGKDIRVDAPRDAADTGAGEDPGAFDETRDDLVGVDVPALNDLIGVDGVLPDTAPIDANTPDGFIPADPGGSDVQPVDTFETGECPGGLYCPCTSPDECLSGFCVETMSGNVCSPLCSGSEGCMQGWDCNSCGTSGSDPVYCCVQPYTKLCQPCKTDQECNLASGSSGKKAICISHGALGSFCGSYCESKADCPNGYDCVDAWGDSGAAKQCKPADDAECPCTDKFKNGSFTTVCYLENQFGKCLGERTCDTQCNAREPLAESCNQEDDNCNGKIDDGVPSVVCDVEPFTYGVCKGKTLCAAGQTICQGLAALPEACNALDDDCDGSTDEDFPDLDKDKTADCVDCDQDGDGVANVALNCPAPTKPDNCTTVANPDQADQDKDGEGDACDADDDGDNVPDGQDNCPTVKNADQANLDGDSQGDSCDCDIDGDGALNANPGCATPTNADNCLMLANADQVDTDGDLIGDACDCDKDGDTIGNANPGCPEPNPADNCPLLANTDQANVDGDLTGDLCDPDNDNDDVPDANDNCRLIPNTNQADTDSDQIGDACDCDIDDDGVFNANPDCPTPDPADNCTYDANPGQEDMDGNGIGDACVSDWDDDGIKNADDNCPLVPNTTQANQDKDLEGDACDCDIDGDGIANTNPDCPTPEPLDNCPILANPGQEDQDSDLAGDACDEDIDGDQDPNATDCMPLDAAISHNAAEVCADSIDNDCDALTDEENATGCATFYLDADADTWGATQSKCLCAANGQYTAFQAGDCDDADAKRNPGVKEICNNSKDDNCNGSDNEENAEGCKNYLLDADFDNYGIAADFKCLCGPVDTYRTLQPGDCDDANDKINPAVPERCSTVADDNCNGNPNDENAEGAKVFYKDEDKDTYGTTESKKYCYEEGVWSSTKSTDCDDTDAAVNPGAREICLNAKDDNCNGTDDEENSEGCIVFFFDSDRDGYGLTGNSRCFCEPVGMHDTKKPGDCNDASAAIHPMAIESCNLTDDDCNGQTDEGDPTVMCSAVANGTPACSAGKCVIGSCKTLFWDVNKLMTDGCECQEDKDERLNDTCGSANAVYLGSLTDDGKTTLTASGRIVPDSDVDWYYFKATDGAEPQKGTATDPKKDTFNVRVAITSPTDASIGVHIVRGKCSDTPLCSTTDNIFTESTWKVNFSEVDPAKSPYGGENPCYLETPQGVGTPLWSCDPVATPCCNKPDCKLEVPVGSGFFPGRHYCVDDTSDFWFKVYRNPKVAGAKTCTATQYTVTVTNGK